MSEKYNGWTNYETWTINLFMGDDDEFISELVNNAEDVYSLSQTLKDIVQEENPIETQSSMYSQLLSGAIGSVNWYELAEAYWRDYRDEEEEETEEE